MKFSVTRICVLYKDDKTSVVIAVVHQSTAQ